jgi:hypothetical protein
MPSLYYTKQKSPLGTKKNLAQALFLFAYTQHAIKNNETWAKAQIY